MNAPEKSAAQTEAIAGSTHGAGSSDERFALAIQRYMAAIATGQLPSETAHDTSGQPDENFRPVPPSGPWQGALVGDVMTKDVIIVDQYAGFKHIAEILARNHVSAVPVVKSDGRILRVVSEYDLLAKVAAGGELRARIGDGLTGRRHLQRKAIGETAADLIGTPAITALATDSVVDAARVAARAHVKRLPVVDEADRVIGVVARSDLLRAFLGDDRTIGRYINDVVLTQQFALSPTTITADVLDGVVTLRGRLDSEPVLGPSSDTLRGAAGVVAVHSELSFDAECRYRPPPQFP